MQGYRPLVKVCDDAAMKNVGFFAIRPPERSARSRAAKSKDQFCPFRDRVTELIPRPARDDHSVTASILRKIFSAKTTAFRIPYAPFG